MCYLEFKRKCYTITKNVEIRQGIYEMYIQAPEVAQKAEAGQFVNVYCQSQSKLLPRPISLCEVNKTDGWIRLIYAVVGGGTAQFAELRQGDSIDVLGPLGHGFTLEIEQEKEDEPSNVLIVGGGVGTPPLLELGKALKERYQDKVHITFALGFRENSYLTKDLEQYGEVKIATDSGNQGYHGHVVGLLETEESKGVLSKIDAIYACGPKPMLKGLQVFAQQRGYQGEFSLEERMGCGFGGCVGCVVPLVNESSDDGFEYMKVCKDGPVFDYRKVIFS